MIKNTLFLILFLGLIVSPAFAYNSGFRPVYQPTSPPGGIANIHDIGNVTSIGCAIGQFLSVNASAIWACASGGSGEINTASNSGHGNSLVLPKVGVDLPFKGIACTGAIDCNINATDITIDYVATGGGNATFLDDLGDVVVAPTFGEVLYYDGNTWVEHILILQQDVGDVLITLAERGDFLWYDGTSWIDKVFSINSITGSNGLLLFGVSNTTGAWTQATIKNPLLDGSNHTDTISQTVSRGSIVYGDSTPKWNELTIGTNGKVLTSDGTDISWQTPSGGTDRESLVANWQTDRTWTNIGVTFVNVYATGLGDPTRIDTNGKTTATLFIDWTKAGAGTQKCKIAQVGAENTILIMHTNLVSGANTNATISIPVAQQNIIANYKIMCLSSTAGDDPVFLSGQVLLR